MLNQWQTVALGRINVLLFLFWGLLLPVAYAQLPPQTSTRLTTTNGLPHTRVRGVEQDQAGFLWIATYDGLVRYDGRMTKVFRHRPGDNTSLSNNKITQLERTEAGQLLVVSGGGSFQLFDPVKELFTTLLHEQYLAQKHIPVSDGHLSADGRHLWGIMQGVRLVDYDIQRKTLQVHSIPELVGGSIEMHDFVLTKSGDLYSQCSTGLLRFNTKTGAKRLVPFPFAQLPRATNSDFWPLNRHQVALAPNGQIAVFGYQIVVLYDPSRDRIRTVAIPGALTKKAIRHGAPRPDEEDNVVTYALKTLTDNKLYLGYQHSVYQLTDDDQFVPLTALDAPIENAAPWLLDHSGVLWVSSETQGLYGLDTHRLPFNALPQRQLFSADLVTQELGVSLPDSFEAWNVANWPRYQRASAPAGYLIDPTRVYRHDVNKPRLTELTALRQLYGQTCCNLCLKTDGNTALLLYNNRKGLIRTNLAGNMGQVYPNSTLPLTRPVPAYDAADIEPMGQMVWVGSQYGLGLFRYDIRRQRFNKPFVVDPKSPNSLPSNNITCLTTDPTDSTVLWIGTADGGLCRLATRTMTFRRFGEAEGLPDNTIHSVEADDQGMLWCTTNRGLLRINTKQIDTDAASQIWRQFTTDDGLPENTFLYNSSARLPDGRLVFGTATGRVIFDPHAIQDADYVPPVVLTSLLINNKPAEANLPGSPLDAPLNALTELVLDHSQNFLTLVFAGLDYGKSAKLTYRYQLTGVDNDWVTVGQQNTANYTQLAPGHYVFSVNSSTADGRWSHQVKQLRIVIKPPFWATWWAYLAYALAFGGLVLGFIRFRTRQIRQQQEIRLKQQEAEQLRAVDEIKTRFFANITHEFRTPLTLILAPIEKLVRQTPAESAIQQTLVSVLHNGRQLLRLVNQLLDLSKLESRNMAISLTRGDALAFIIRVAESVRPLAVNRQLTLHINDYTPTDKPFDGPWLFDADKWEKIVLNLLSNALKFTPAGGQVSMRLELPTADRLTLQLTDTGVGIPAQHISHIFDRFYQVDTSRTRAYEGTGIGLALVKELTDLLGGTLTVASRTEAPSGTTFTLTLPLRPATDQADAPELVLPDTTATNLWTITSGRRTSDLATPPVAGDAPLILVIDDNEELRTFIACELQDRYRVLMAANGEEGWDICQRELPDVVISDIMMPQLDGYQLTQRIKSTLATNHLAVILLTARTAHESRIAGLEQGADDYLTKPFHTDELMLRLENMITRQANLRAYLHRQLSTPPVTDEPIEDAFVRQLHQIIEARLDDSTFGIDDLAGAVSMSRRTLNRKLAATANMAASDFIRNYRLQRAMQLLKVGRSISQTAYQVGFESPSYFTTVFKQTYHQTPSEFVSRQQA